MAQIKNVVVKSTYRMKNTQTTGKSLFEWFVEVVGMSLLPSILYAILLYFDKKTFNYVLIFGNGDLLMAAAIVSATSLLHVFLYKQADHNKRITGAFILSLFCIFVCMLLFAGVKLGRLPYENVSGASIAFVLCAFVASYAVERY